MDEPRGELDQNAAEHRAAGRVPRIWNVFKAPGTSMEVLATCDAILGRMSPGWWTRPTRYDVLAAALRRQSQSLEMPDHWQADYKLFVQNDLFLRKLSAVSHFPGKEREAYQLFDEFMKSAPRPSGSTAF